MQLGFWARFRFCHSNACCSNALRQDLEWGFPGGSDSKESTCNVRDLDLISGSGRSPGGGHDNLLQYSCLENPHGQRCLAGFRPRGHKESAMTEWLAQHKVWKKKVSQGRKPFEGWSYTISSQGSMHVTKPEAQGQNWHLPIPVAFRGRTALQTSWPWISVTKTVRKYISALDCLSICGTLFQHPWEANTGGYLLGGHERFLTQGLQDLKTSHCTRHFLPLPAVFRKNLNTALPRIPV